MIQCKLYRLRCRLSLFVHVSTMGVISCDFVMLYTGENGRGPFNDLIPAVCRCTSIQLICVRNLCCLQSLYKRIPQEFYWIQFGASCWECDESYSIRPQKIAQITRLSVSMYRCVVENKDISTMEIPFCD